ncbi:hypothetical protein GCM10027168_24210 [Streptomyces capparidis]
MFWFMLVALAAVVAAVALLVLGPGGGLPEAEPERPVYPLPPDRPVNRVDLDTLRLPMALRGYRMADVDDVLDRVAAELAMRDQRIAELEALLAAGAAAPAPAAQQPPAPGGAPAGRPAPAGHEENGHRGDGGGR